MLKKFLKDVLNPANPTITNSTKQIIINLNEFERLNKRVRYPNNWTTTAWDKVIKNELCSINFQEKKKKTPFLHSLKSSYQKLYLKENTMMLLKSLIEYTYFNNQYEHIINSLNIVQSEDSNILDFESLDAFVTRYKKEKRLA